MNGLIESEENELKLIITEETQAKLAALRGKGTSEGEVREILRIVKAAFNLAEFDISQELVETIIDDYFDTDDLAIYRVHASLRVRRSRGKTEVTVKKLKGIEQGLFSRQEKSEEITEEKYSELVRTGFRDVIVASFPDLRDKRFSLLLRVDNERRSFHLNRRGEQYALALDLFIYKIPNTDDFGDVQSEVEIEALNTLAKSKLEDIRRNLVDIVKDKGFNYSTDSKYERGVKYFGLDQPSRMQWLQEKWNTPKGLAWIGIAVSALGIVLAVIFWLFTR